MPDTIVRRVHGVHMGEHLLSDFNTNPSYGDFHMYEGLVFPANVKNCVKCHTDDSWKNAPSREACGACHDNLDFATGGYVPYKTAGMSSCAVDADCSGVFSGFNGLCNTTTGDCELRTHGGGAATNDTACAACHTPDTGGLAPISVVHDIPAPAFSYGVNLSMTLPNNATHYVAGESPVVTVQISDSSTNPVDPATITEATFGRAYLYVSGPREHTEPVLTTAAEGTAAIRAAVDSTVAGPWDFTGLADLQVAVDGGSADTILVSAGTWGAIDAVTADEVVTWLNAALSSATASASKSSRTAPANDVVTVKSNTKGSGSTVQILASDVATALGIAAGTYVPEESAYYPENDFRVRTDPVDEDPRITRHATDFDYALDDVAGLEPGTYTVWVEAGAMPPMSWAKLNFQVGTATEEAPVATNCNDCHEGTTMHASYFAVEFDTDICKSCHDYERQLLGQVGWAAANNGFGSAPLARRVHGVHRGKYLAAPEEVNQIVDYSHVVFPQDIRNCTKCHADNPSWMDGASRLACLSCHDSEDAKTHGLLNTFDPTPEDPWSGDEIESCGACHGADRQFAPAEVHNISDPYAPPYPR